MKDMAGIGGINAYQQTNQIWKEKKEGAELEGKNVNSKDPNSNIKTSTWKPVNTNSSLVPTNTEGIGMTVGDVQLSDKAKEYYSKLKAKYGNMQFIAVSSDMKDQVKANAASYGNSNKMVVLIDDAKLEQMANDEAFRKKYEGIIAMAQNQMASAKNSLTSSGASIKNFGMSVNSDGSYNFFATVEKSYKDQAKRLEKKQAEKKAAKAKEKKIAEKKAEEERLEKRREDSKIKENDNEDRASLEDKEYVRFEAASMDELVDMVSKYAYNNSSKKIMTDSEKAVGQNFDFKG